jgi:hypothetical protein
MKRNLLGLTISILTFVALTVALIILFQVPATNVSGQTDGSRGWRVWIRTSPCVGRHDWLSVAREQGGAGTGSGLATYVLYDTYLPRGTNACIQGEPYGCTYAEATALMESLRGHAKFFDLCCRDYSVWENTDTNKRSVVLGDYSAGIGWRLVRGNLCCEEAEELAGTPGVCGGYGQGGKAGYIGCYKDTSAFDLDGYLERSGSNTPESCVAKCLAKGFKYAGVQYGESCLCGNSYGRYGPADNCNMKCTGDSGKICGGYSANSVFSTGTGGTTVVTKPPDEIDLAGNWLAAITESNTGYSFKYNLVLQRESAGRWSGPFRLEVAQSPALGFQTNATVEALGAGKLRITYIAQGRTQVGEGTYTKDRITFGGSQNTVVFTKVN